MRTIAVSNQKGGVAKTTTAAALAAAWEAKGKRVLLVDMDYQGNLTRRESGRQGIGLYPFLLEGATIPKGGTIIGSSDKAALLPSKITDKRLLKRKQLNKFISETYSI